MKLSRKSRLARLASATLGVTVAANALAPVLAQNPLNTGKKITQPALGVRQNVGSLPMHLLLTPDGKFAISTDMGFRQSLHAVSTLTGQSVSHLDFAPNNIGTSKNSGAVTDSNGLYYGLAIAPNGDGTSTLYAAQGGQAGIAVVSVGADGALTAKGTIPMRGGDFPAGLALDDNGLLYVAVNEYYGGPDPTGALTQPGKLVIYNTKAAGVVQPFGATPITVPSGGALTPGTPANATPAPEVARVRVIDPTLPYNAASPNNFPLAVAALRGGSKVYVTSQRDGAVFIYDTSTPSAPALAKVLPTGAHPDAVLFNKAQTTLYVGNAHSDTVSAISTANDTLEGSIALRPRSASTLVGATPTGLALSPDERTLYVTLGDMNAVAVVDAAAQTVKGYIPAGWYPTGVVASPVRRQLLVTDGKGTKTRYPNPQFKQYDLPGGQSSDSAGTYYDLNLIEGQVQTVAVPNSVQLAQDTQQVLSNNRLAEIGNAPPVYSQIGLKAGGITHVIYMVKENRTYDQILGDLPQGNGDPSLAIFGKKVTPNLHALATRFVTLDNFYDCGEASGDGWPWSTQSIATEYVIKDLPYNYSGRGRNYDFEGQNNGYLTGGFAATDPNGKPNSVFFTNGAPAVPDVSEAPAHHIWDLVKDANLPYRNYGFFTSFGVSVPGVGPVLPDNYPTAKGLLPTGHFDADTPLASISDFDFRRFDTSYPDSDAPSQNGFHGWSKTSYGKYSAPSRFSEWKREFELLANGDTSGRNVPAFETVRFMSDHTAGVSAGVASPQAHVADNDYAVGQLVEELGKYPDIWKHTAVFVIEDDAQDGPDHVDAHRSTCYVISPFIKKNSVDHTFYNTDSVLKSIELLLGLPAMSQYDAVATPFLDFDTAPNNADAYAAITPDPTVLNDVPGATAMKPGTALYRLAQLTKKMDFLHPDSAPAGLLNEVIWKSVKGANAKVPAPVHNAKIEARLHLSKVGDGKKAARDED